MLKLHDGHHHHPSSVGQQANADSIWEQEHIELVTVGIDIGSSTSHLIFAKIHLQRKTQSLSSRYEVISREILWESEIQFTPFLASGLIDSDALGLFIKNAYAQAGLAPTDIDSGAVILTGEAIKRSNARLINELFAKDAGKFVCATAGHRLECVLAAHGSGATAMSKSRKQPVLHVDIGGGTTKLALIDDGRVVSVAAYAIGGRLIASADGAVWDRADQAAIDTALDIGAVLDEDQMQSPELRLQITERLAQVLSGVILRASPDLLTQKLALTEPLSWSVEPTIISFSGGVSEYIYGRETRSLGDIAMDLGGLISRSLTSELDGFDLVPVSHGIRATVIGASQFTVQVSGKTIYGESLEHLPLRNVPVINPDLDLARDRLDRKELSDLISSACLMRDLDPKETLALAFVWGGMPLYERLATVAGAIVDSFCKSPRENPLIIVIDGDVGRLIGKILVDELGVSNVLSLDGVLLSDLDYIDVGEMISPPGVIPIVIKSLIFDAEQS
ncbi:ethanolamine ammonia-lyase reactivating factor EutA [Litorivicinus sp.]|nr:ethanolamine ammonia-lyase reactivating factor EutA [Litorivicinus sp.]